MVLDNDFQLGEWRVKPQTNMIEGSDGEAHLEPKAMQVLALLAQRAGDVVHKQEILEDVWDGTYVSDEVLPNAIWELRKALGDASSKPFPKRGTASSLPSICGWKRETPHRPSERRLCARWRLPPLSWLSSPWVSRSSW